MPFSDRLEARTAEYNGLKANPVVTFEQQLKIFELEEYLAHLHLAAAELIKDKDMIAAGQHLQAAISFNPFIIKELSDLFSLYFPDATEYPTMDKAVNTASDVIVTLAFIPGVILGAIGEAVGKLVAITPNTLINSGVSRAQSNYVHSVCLKDIPNTQTAQECLAEGIAHFYEKD
ncbi:MAG: hypothetical protein ABSF18_00205, partial [Gammaproteobacteria bacterium]